MHSLFKRLYAQRPSDGRNQLENFLTEAFAYALEKDIKFRTRWVASLNWPNMPKAIDCKIETQVAYLGSQPDLELRGENFKILVECKIESQEGMNQLQRYGQILCAEEPQTSKFYAKENQVLVYLTKHYEPKNKPEDFKGHFACYRWYQVHDLISPNDSPFTLELKQYIKELDMAQNDNFTYHDLNALLTIHGTIRKMDKALDLIRPMATKELGANFYPSNRSTSLQRDPAYYNNAFFNYTHIDLGFTWWYGDNEVYLYAAHFIHTKSEKAFGEHESVIAFGEQLGWEKAGIDNRWHGWVKRFPLSKVLSADNDHILTIEKWFKERIEEWVELKVQVPSFFQPYKGNGMPVLEQNSEIS